jgi:RNA polymerase sigma-70 factor (ECF subfamily)
VDDGAIDLLTRWQAGDERAAEELFRRYADRLIALARSRLSTKLAGRVDAEDVVQSAYRSFFADARAGGYSIERGGDLWRLLVSITLHKLQDQVDRHTAGKRSIDQEQAFGNDDSFPGIRPQLLSREPSPVEAATLADELEQVMRCLQPVERRMLELRLQGYNLEEIGAAMDCSERTAIRTLNRVKEHLKQVRFGNTAD